MTVREISSFGERNERLLITLALVGIVIWGFAGFEYPQPEISGQPVRTDATLTVDLGGSVESAARTGPGAELFQANGCYACHSLEGERIIGPSLLGIYGTTVELEDGSSTLVDDAYLVESILQPDAKRVAGYGEAAMPSYDGLVSTEDAEALADYIKSLR